MSETILLVFEGKTEKEIVKNIEKNFFQKDKQIIKAVYGTNIYGLFRKIIDDLGEYLDIVELLKENKISSLKDVEREKVTTCVLRLLPSPLLIAIRTSSLLMRRGDIKT